MSDISVRNTDGGRPAATIRQEPVTAAGLPALAVAQDDSSGAVIQGKGGGTLLDLRNTSMVQKFKVDNSGNVTAGGSLVTAAGGAEPLASGEAIFQRSLGLNEILLTTQRLQLTFFTACTTGTATTVSTLVGDTGAASVTYAAVGFYSVDGSGNLALIATTGDLHASLWASTFTLYASTLTTTFTRTAGTRYAMGILCVGTTMPNLVGAALFGGFAGIAPTLSANVGSQSTLPATVSAATVAANADRFLFEATVAP